MPSRAVVRRTVIRSGRVAITSSKTEIDKTKPFRHADSARRGLDARGFESRHELLEAEPFDAAQRDTPSSDEAVEGDLVFLHAAIAKHLDLGARHAGDYFIYFTSPISWRENLAVIDFERLCLASDPIGHKSEQDLSIVFHCLIIP